MRNKHWIQTYTGKRFAYDDPSPAMICIEDIARALSMQVRFNGHLNEFYSVAEHSVRASYLVEEKYALMTLLHDATEAYMGDLPTPLKTLLPEFKKMEALIWNKAIAPHFGLSYTFKEAESLYKKADLLMLSLEKNTSKIVPDYGYDWDIIDPPADCKISSPLKQPDAEMLFLSRFKELI